MKHKEIHICGFMSVAVLFLACSSRSSALTPVDVSPTGNCSGVHTNCSGVHTGDTLERVLKSLNSSTLLNLLPGVHCITSYTLVTNLNLIKIQGGRKASITCEPDNGLAFLNVSNLTIDGVTIQGCGLGKELIYEFKQNVTAFGIDFFFTGDASNDSIAILCAECSNFTVRNSMVTDTDGLGFLGINVRGDSKIDNVHFLRNFPSVCFHEQVGIVQDEQIGGGAIFTYHDYEEVDCPSCSKTTMLSVTNSTFSYNSYCGVQTLFESYYRYSEATEELDFLLGAGGGLSVVYAQLTYKVNTTIQKSYFQNNTAKYGGGVQVQLFSGVYDSHVVFEDCLFTKNGLGDDLYSNINYTSSGAALSIFLDFLQPNFSTNVKLKPSLISESTVNVIRSNFTENLAFSGGAVTILSLFSSLFGGIIQDNILFDKCLFENNIAIIGSALYIQEWKQSATQRGLNVDLNDVTIQDNTVLALSSITSAVQNSAVIEILSVNLTISGTSIFQHNRGTGIRTVSGIIHFKDNVTFLNNSASYAGALRVDNTGIIIVNNNTKLIFENNTGAVYGGAIVANFLATLPAYVHNDCFLYFGFIDIFCFADITLNCSNVTDLNISVIFKGNTAPLGGVMYGSTLETCPWAGKIRMDNHINESVHILEYLAQPELYGHNYTLFQFGEDQIPNTISTVSTATSRIEIETKHGLPISSLSVVPGQTLEIYVKLLDHFNQPIPGIITSRVSKLADDDLKGMESRLGDSNYWFLEKPKENGSQSSLRTPLTVTGNSTRNSEFNLTLYAIDSLTQTEFAVNLTDCPPGFTYANSTACVCDENINKSRGGGISCESNGELSISSEIWIGYGPDDSEYLAILGCQFDYCQSGKKKIRPPDFDSLCRDGYHRTGIACGQCAENYSVIFGSNQCRKCTSFWVFYSLIFLLQGISVITSICFLRITISEGYLNGVLFYANVVSIYLPVFSYSTNLSTVFVIVSWLNLDWGIPACFYDGMTALESTALEFFFPLYLYFLMVCIVLISRHSKRFTNWFARHGFSAVKLFATLVVMTYTSLLQTCVEILGATHVRTFDGKLHFQWTRDPNQGYFSGKHIPLGLLAILLLIFFLIPLPFLLIFPAIIFKVKYLRRFKPIYDALWAPFKPAFRFWVGLRLLLRAFPIMFLSFLTNVLSVLMLALFILTLYWVQSIIQPFRGIGRNAFDNFFLANILVLAIGYIYFYIYVYNFDLDVKRNAVHLNAYTEGYFYSVVMTAYIAFVLIVIWHLMLRFPKLKKLPLVLFKRLRSKMKKGAHSKDKKTFSINSDADTKTYGATESDLVFDTENDTTEDGESKQRATYSELREPLLESGSLELTPAHQTL